VSDSFYDTPPSSGLYRATRTPTVKSKWDEARETIALWEKVDPKAKYVVLILDGEKDIIMDCHGGTIKPSDLAGLCFAAATMAVDA